MSDSSDEEVYVEIPYRKRPEWADIKPIFQDDETNEIVRIAYTDTFKDVFDYFRAIVKLNEKSERAFLLSKDAALLNPANYTVWYYRRLLIKELNLDAREELDFITNVVRSNPKNYQVWQHRKSIVEMTDDPSQELLFTQQILKKDSKNYHAWQYRQWAIKKFGLWIDEIEYINQLLDKDIRNNSAWNQRYFIISNTNDLNKASAYDILSKEVDFCLDKLEKCLDNESTWNYLRGLIAHLSIIAKDESAGSIYPQKIIDFCNSKFTSPKDEHKSPFLIAFLVDYNLTKAKKLKTELSEQKQDDLKAILNNLVNSSIEMLQSLVERYDTIRHNYWNYLISKWKQEFAEYL